MYTLILNNYRHPFFQDNGYSIEIGGETVILHGAVLCMLGDTPASNFLGGFKEGIGFALRKCRRCMITSSDICVKVSDVYKINEYTCLKHPTCILFAFSSMQTS